MAFLSWTWNLLTCMPAFSPKASFADFKLQRLMELAKLNPNDFSSAQLKDLVHELPIYIYNLQVDDRFSGLNYITEFVKLMVDTKKHLVFPLVDLSAPKASSFFLPIAITSMVMERCFSAMKIVKTISCNRIGKKFIMIVSFALLSQSF